jgi:hypothetical protein
MSAITETDRIIFSQDSGINLTVYRQSSILGASPMALEND